MNPRFDNVELVDQAPTELLRSPRLRTTREHLPDVRGEFFQVRPPGGREVVVRGVLASSWQATAALAEADFKTKVRTRQQRVGSSATYQGVDEQLYPNSLLLSWRPLGALQLSQSAAGVQAMGRVEARIVTQP